MLQCLCDRRCRRKLTTKLLLFLAVVVAHWCLLRDVGVARSIEGGIFSVLATGGDTHLGGEDFDDNIVDHLMEVIKKTFTKDQFEEVKSSKRALRRLRTAAEQAKCLLSAAVSASVEVRALSLSPLSRALRPPGAVMRKQLSPPRTPPHHQHSLVFFPHSPTHHPLRRACTLCVYALRVRPLCRVRLRTVVHVGTPA
jgi:hypothetical protein